MKSRILSLLAATALATAADVCRLRCRSSQPGSASGADRAAPIFTWTGFYVGGNLGAGWRDSNNDPVILTGPGIPGGLEGGTLVFGNNNDATFTGGGQIGYNYQIGSWVIGAEADIQGIDSGNNANAVFFPGPGFAGGDFVAGEFEKVRIGGARRACAPVSPSTASWSTPPVVWPTRKTTPAGRSAVVSSGPCR